MYKVFLNEKTILLTEETELESLSNGMLYFQYDDFEELHFVLGLLEDHEGLNGVIVQCDDVEELWADFRAHFRELDAAGGLVTNSNGDLLLIHRLGKWDLPKGKCEADESIDKCALREVTEECGIEDLVLGSPLPETYHAYSLKGIRHLKRTYWFKMKGEQEVLTPQAEEGIVEARWVSPGSIDWDVMPSYPNIRQLIDGHNGSY